jgi:hypothetical protein
MEKDPHFTVSVASPLQECVPPMPSQNATSAKAAESKLDQVKLVLCGCSGPLQPRGWFDGAPSETQLSSHSNRTGIDVNTSA